MGMTFPASASLPETPCHCQDFLAAGSKSSSRHRSNPNREKNSDAVIVNR